MALQLRRLWVFLSLILMFHAYPAVGETLPRYDVSLKPVLQNGEVAALGVTMRIPEVVAKAGTPFLTMRMISFGVDTARLEAANLQATDTMGPLALIQTDDPVDPANTKYYRRWAADREIVGPVTLSYQAPPRRLAPGVFPPGPVFDMRAESGGLTASGLYFLILPPSDETRYDFRIRWDLSAMPPGARGVWTHGEGEVSKPLSVQEFSGAVFMAGPVKSWSGAPKGKLHFYWLTDPDWNVSVIGPEVQRVFDEYARLTAHPDPSTRVFIRRGNDNGGSGGGGSFLMYTPSAGSNAPSSAEKALLPFLSHEVFHQFAGMLDDAAIGLPSFWWSEGVTTFYSDVIPYRLGLKSLDEHRAAHSRFIENYYSSPARLLSYKEITDGMFGSIGMDVMYAKGHVFMMLLDARIRARSGGTRSLDNLVFPLVRQRLSGGSYTRADFEAALERELGAEGIREFQSFLAGGSLLDLPPELMGPCFRREKMVFHPISLGFNRFAATAGARSVVRNLDPQSAAAKAGIREGDEILTRIDIEALEADPQAMVKLNLVRAEQPLTISFDPHLKPLDGYKWLRDPSVPEAQCRI